MERLGALALGLLFASVPLAAHAQSPAPEQAARLQRLASVGRLWGAIRYFHPWLAHKPINWDSAFVAAYPRLSTATTRDDFAAAVESLLAPLGDPATRVTGSVAPAVLPADSLTTWLPDSTLLVRFAAVGDLADFMGVLERLGGVARTIGTSRATILDFRGANPSPDPENIADVAMYFGVDFGVPAFQAALVGAPVTTPARRARMHSGLVPESGTTSGGYYSAFYAIDGKVIQPDSAARWRPVAAIVDAASVLPAVLEPIRAMGYLRLVAVGGIGESSAGTYGVALDDSLTVTVRLEEPVGGSSALVPDTLLAPGEDSTAVAVAAGLVAPDRFRVRPATPAGPAPAQPDEASSTAPGPAYPDSASRVLAAYKYWAAIQYFFPYMHLIGEDWGAVLAPAIGRLEGARDSLEYVLALVDMSTHIHDSHGFIVNPTLRAYRGDAVLPVEFRMVQGRPVIVSLLDSSAVQAGLRMGDELLSLDGIPAMRYYADLAPGATSTPQSDMHVRMSLLARGPEGSTAELVVRNKDGKHRSIRLKRLPGTEALQAGLGKGPAFRLLSSHTGYADLTRLTVPQVDSMFDAFAATKAIIFDMRGYPNGTAWSIAPRLATAPGLQAARFSRPLRMGPDTTYTSRVDFAQLVPPSSLPRYAGRTVMLIDERAMSQAEHTGLFFEAANGTVFIGTPTAGANGDITNVVVPGGATMYFSGHDVRHADGRQLQRVGLQPTVRVEPTIAGIRAGRDEVLDAALRYLQSK